MGKKRVLAAATFVLAVFLYIAPESLAALVPTETTLDFGEMIEADGRQTRRTFLVNEGKDDVAITRIRTTCGCTGASYFTDVIHPGDSAWVDITYDPSGRFGDFEKTVKVFTTDSETIPLRIKGSIRNSEETIAKRYPYRAGPLRLSEKKLLCGTLDKGERRSFFVNFYNMSDRTVTPAVESSDEAVSVSIGPVPVPPYSVGSISVIPNGMRALPTGHHEMALTLVPDGSNPEETVTIEMYIEIE